MSWQIISPFFYCRQEMSEIARFIFKTKFKFKFSPFIYFACKYFSLKLISQYIFLLYFSVPFLRLIFHLFFSFRIVLHKQISFDEHYNLICFLFVFVLCYFFSFCCWRMNPVFHLFNNCCREYLIATWKCTCFMCRFLLQHIVERERDRHLKLLREMNHTNKIYDCQSNIL